MYIHAILFADYQGLVGLGLAPGVLGAAVYLSTMIVPPLLATHAPLRCAAPRRSARPLDDVRQELELVLSTALATKRPARSPAGHRPQSSATASAQGWKISVAPLLVEPSRSTTLGQANFIGKVCTRASS